MRGVKRTNPSLSDISSVQTQFFVSTNTTDDCDEKTVKCRKRAVSDFVTHEVNRICDPSKRNKMLMPACDCRYMAPPLPTCTMFILDGNEHVHIRITKTHF